MSPLHEALQEYLAVRRALGFHLKKVERTLRRFVEFAEAEGAGFITTELALRWAQAPTPASPAYQAARLGMVRLFARHCSSLDPRTEVPPAELLPHKVRRQTPYLYSDTEIVRLVEAARLLPSRTGLRAATISTVLGLIAVTGMRRGEPIALDREDVDLAHGILTIRRSKFGKSRCLPLHPSTQQALERYRSERDRLCPRPQTPSFFVSEQGTRISQWALYAAFVKVSRQIGLRGPADRHGPRLHDLRHTFALRTILGWYRDGQDVERFLPRLATYLGHTHVTDTYWYLTATPELLRAAALRLDTAQEEGRP
jgi:integrase